MFGFAIAKWKKKNVNCFFIKEFISNSVASNTKKTIYCFFLSILYFDLPPPNT